MKETMTVHKALSELKILSNRIENKINFATFVVANKHSNTKISGEPVNEYCRQMKEEYQSIRTLIARRNAIKRAVIRSNAVTKVMVAGVELTVAEAIDMKTAGMEFVDSLKNKLAYQLNLAKNRADMENEKLVDRTDNYMKTMYASTDLKNMSEEMQKVRDNFVTSQTFEIVDPIGVAQEVNELTEQIDAFMSEVDSALSVSNALTTVEVEYDTF